MTPYISFHGYSRVCFMTPPARTNGKVRQLTHNIAHSLDAVFSIPILYSCVHNFMLRHCRLTHKYYVTPSYHTASSSNHKFTFTMSSFRHFHHPCLTQVKKNLPILFKSVLLISFAHPQKNFLVKIFQALSHHHHHHDICRVCFWSLKDTSVKRPIV